MTLGLTIQNLAVTLQKRSILQGLNLSANGGDVISIIGQNGAGKSTLLKALAGLMPYTGTVHVEVNGQRQKKPRIAYLPQLTASDSRLTVFEMVLLGLGQQLGWRVPQASIDQVDETLHLLRIQRLADRPVASLSGGQRQLVFMAQAFVSRPQILLLDEPTSALDLRHQLIVMDAARAYAKTNQALTLMVVHDLLLASRFSDRLAMLEGGALSICAAPEAVLTPEALSRVYRVSVSVEKSHHDFIHVVPLQPLADATDGQADWLHIDHVHDVHHNHPHQLGQVHHHGDTSPQPAASSANEPKDRFSHA